MSKYFLPLWVFVGGHLLMLAAYLLLGTMGDAVTTMNAETAAYSSVFWNWAWVSNPSVVQFLIFFMLEMGVLYATFKSFMAIR